MHVLRGQALSVRTVILSVGSPEPLAVSWLYACLLCGLVLSEAAPACAVWCYSQTSTAAVSCYSRGPACLVSHTVHVCVTPAGIRLNITDVSCVAEGSAAPITAHHHPSSSLRGRCLGKPAKHAAKPVLRGAW